MSQFTKENLAELATLARLDFTDEEVAGYQASITDILGFLDQLDDAQVPDDKKQPDDSSVNTMRADTDPHQGGEYTAQLLQNAPETKDGFIKVPKILSQGNSSGGAA